MKKSYPNRSKPLPTGIINVKRKVITNPDEKKRITLKHFENRMRKRQTAEGVKDIVEINSESFDESLKSATATKNSPFTMKELDKVLKSLKNGKSKYPDQ